MELTRTAYGTWSGGRYMHFGEALGEERYLACIRRAYEQGIRTFMTADVYSLGEADTMLGRALHGLLSLHLLDAQRHQRHDRIAGLIQ